MYNIKHFFTLCTALIFLYSCKNDSFVDYAKNKNFEQMLNDFTVTTVIPNKALVLLDNDMAFQKKIDIIQAARKELRLAYYIFGHDESSSFLIKELVKAATERNVKVKLLVDLHFEYANLDFFTALEKAGQGNIQIHFYGRADINVMKDVVYLTSSCPKDIKSAVACARYKRIQVEKAVPNLMAGKFDNGLSGLFLSGLYAKDMAVLANAVVNGQDINISDYQSDDGSTMSKEDKEGLLEFVKIYFKSKMESSLFKRLYNKLRLKLALLKYADKLNPIYGALQEHLPIKSPSREGAKDGWAHLTDFSHHKLIIADKKMMQLGGRNIENSYHMKLNDFSSKYVFMDTDVYVDIKSGGKDIEDSFDRLYNYAPMVLSLKQVQTMMPNDFVANRKLINEACKIIDEIQFPEAFKKCSAPYEKFSREDRAAIKWAKVEENAKKYSRGYLGPKFHPLVEQFVYNAGLGGYFRISEQAKLHYVENIPYIVKQGKAGERIFGTKLNETNFKSKGIHGVWIYNLLRSCVDSEKENRNIEIVLNNAYFFPSAELLNTFARMMDGSLDCSRVTITMMTNSAATTDLGAVNLLAQMSMKAFFTSVNHKAFVKLGKGKAATFRLYEYNDLSYNENDRSVSLHTKAIAFDKGLFIGSANFDTRSLVLDTNNGFFIMEDQTLLDDYKNLMQERIKNNMTSQIADSKRPNFYGHVTIDEILEHSWKEIDQKFLQNEGITESRKKVLRKSFYKVMKTVFKYTQNILHGRVLKKTPIGESDTALRKRIIIDVRALEDSIRKFNLLTKEI